MADILQRVTVANTVLGQKVKFIGYKAWWNIVEKRDETTILKRGKQTKTITNDTVVLQELFSNLTNFKPKKIMNQMEGVRVPKNTRKFK